MEKLPNKSEKVYLVIGAQVFPIKKPVTTLGRALDNDLVIQNSLVSRHHAELRVEDGQFILYDLNSTSGTFIENEKIENRPLKSGDHIHLANVSILFVIETEPLEDDSETETGRL